MAAAAAAGRSGAGRGGCGRAVWVCPFVTLVQGGRAGAFIAILLLSRSGPEQLRRRRHAAGYGAVWVALGLALPRALPHLSLHPPVIFASLRGLAALDLGRVGADCKEP